MGGYPLNVMANQAIVVEGHAAGQSGEFYLAVFGDFIVATDTMAGSGFFIPGSLTGRTNSVKSW